MAPPSPPRDRRADTTSALHKALSEAHLADLRDVLDDAHLLLNSPELPRFDEIFDFETASRALSSGWRLITEAVSGSGSAKDAVCGAPDLNHLLMRVGEAETHLRVAETKQRERSVRIAWEALSRLQDVTTVPQLIEVGSEAVCSMGFDRAIVSRIHESTWLTESIHVDRDSEWAQEILAAGRMHPQTIAPGLPEQDLVRRRKPIVVTDVQHRAQVHHAVADASQSRSYVAAAIMPRSKVIGFLHGDRYFHRGDVSQFDSDLLGMFAQGFSFALERAMLLQQLEDLRENVRLLSGHFDDVMGEDRGWPAKDRKVPRLDPAMVLQMHVDPRDDDSNLTRREVEVLRLMAAGDTNVRIAHKLIISEGTVKSHVKHILRKLEAANRAEAVAKWHNAQGPRA